MKGNPEAGNVNLPHLIVAQSYSCNYNCAGCNVVNGKPSPSLSKAEVTKIIDEWTDYVSRNGGKGIFHVKGGEPLLFDDLFDTLNYAADKGLYVFITTNASLFGEKEYGGLEKIFQKTDGQVIVSLDGSTNEINNLSRQANSYDKVLETVKEFKRRSIPFALNYKVHEGNQEDVEEGVYLAKKFGAEQFNLLPHTKIKAAVDKDNEIPDSEVILLQLDKARNNGARHMLEWSIADMIRKLGSGEYECGGCTVGFRGFAYITPNGNVYSCPNTVMEEHKLGTINDSFEELFENGQARNLRQIHNGRLVCKGELEAYGDQPESIEKLVESERLIKQKINEIETADQTKKPIAVCFNRNW